MAKRLPLLRVRQRLLECALRDAGSLGGNADASAIERRERNFISFAFIPDAITHGHFAIGERKLRARRRVNTEFFFFFPGFESRRSTLNHQRRDPFFAFCRIGVYVDDGRVGHAAIGNPRLVAVNDVAVVFAHSFSCQRRCV